MDPPDKTVTEYLTKSSFGTQIRVRKESDTVLWHSSIAYYELMNYINSTSTAIQGIQKRDSSAYQVSPTMQNLVGIFDRMLHGLTANTAPPPEGEAKPGLTEQYHSWLRYMIRNTARAVERAVPVSKCEHIAELGQYLAGSFGNLTRIDYGTGHELSFLFFLCSLFRTEILEPEDMPAAALLIFQRYLYIVRELQSQFKLKPAGSQGPYSLDDYQFVSYMWGVAQLCYDAPFDPSEMLEPSVYLLWKHEYILADCISYLGRKKSGGFAGHSHQLWSLSAVSSFKQIYRGLHHMYMDEVICQFHMMRHITFGTIMSFDPAPLGMFLQRINLGYVKKESLSLEEEATSSSIFTLPIDALLDYQYQDEEFEGEDEQYEEYEEAEEEQQEPHEQQEQQEQQKQQKQQEQQETQEQQKQQEQQEPQEQQLQQDATIEMEKSIVSHSGLSQN